MGKYSEFINFPIYLWGSKEVDKEADQEADGECCMAQGASTAGGGGGGKGGGACS